MNPIPTILPQIQKVFNVSEAEREQQTTRLHESHQTRAALVLYDRVN